MFRPSKTAIRLSLAVALLAVAALVVFLYTFDLDRYRTRIEETLSSRLDTPVHLGEARLTLRHGIAFAFKDIRIGEEEDKNRLTARELLFIIETLPLLAGELRFHEAFLEKPVLTLELPERQRDREPPAATPMRLPFLPTISELTIKDGTIHFHRPATSDAPPIDINMTDLQGSLAVLPLGEGRRLTFSGSLSTLGSRSVFNLETTVQGENDSWRNALFSLHVDLDDLPATALSPVLPSDGREKVGGLLSLSLSAEGTPTEGIRVRLDARSEDLALPLPALYNEPLRTRNTTIDFRWFSSPDEERVESITVDVGGIGLNGSARLYRTTAGEKRVEGNFHSPPLNLPHILSLAPDKNSTVPWLRKSLENGTARIDELRISGSLDPERKDTLSFLQKASISIEDTTFSWGETALRGISLHGDWAENRLTLTEGRGLFLDEPVLFSGALVFPQGSPAAIDLSFSHSLQTEKTLALLPLSINETTSITGSLPVMLRISGALREPLFDISADLTPLKVNSEPYLTKAADIPARFIMAGRIQNGIQIDHSLLSLPDVNLRGQGVIPLSEPFGAEGLLDLELTDLEKSHSLSPVLGKIDARGELLFHCRLKRGEDSLERAGEIVLRDAGVHLTKTIGDINRANGKITFSYNSCSFDDLSVHVGSSQLFVDGEIPDISSPVLSLHAQGRSVRSNDLIFHNEEAYLRDVDGRLHIDGDGIVFETVKVRLDGGTRADVRGFLRDFHDPDVQLNIEANYGNIDEVIALWHSKSPGQPKPKNTAKRKKSFKIRVLSHEGHLGPLKFRNASGLITRPEGILTIAPLSFETDSGSCDAQLTVDTSRSPATLKTSGTIREIDSKEIFINLLKRQGLVSGRLTGEFSIEGPLGHTFINHASGEAKVKVKDGVLSRFKFLSKVFSLLNISQIFSLKLPDMEREGMPFERIDASFKLRDGVLSTEDLFIKSNAMNLSLVGDIDIANKKLDMVLGVKPLRTVDKIITNIPIAGWILAGEEKALITAHFHISGPTEDPSVLPVPITSLSEKVTGIFRRTFGLPAKIVTDIGEFFSNEPEKADK